MNNTFHISISNKTDSTSGEGTSYLPEDQSSPPVFSGIHVARSFVSMKCFAEHYLSLFFWPSVFPVLLRLMASPTRYFIIISYNNHLL